MIVNDKKDDESCDIGLLCNDNAKQEYSWGRSSELAINPAVLDCDEKYHETCIINL